MRRATAGFSALARLREPDFTALRVKATTLRSTSLAQGDLRSRLLIGPPPRGAAQPGASHPEPRP
ncbi:MAG: hypothetical protein A3E25_15480 [Burkholderiales bacterium RIFCSPHIGHO2_12_FULL_69_20]|nr:MAG: hypothetical protein A3E25_15480 [Burkholderiales bacterium RIFCSPHIGHO2_12_FULL_69_20]